MRFLLTNAVVMETDICDSLYCVCVCVLKWEIGNDFSKIMLLFFSVFMMFSLWLIRSVLVLIVLIDPYIIRINNLIV